MKTFIMVFLILSLFSIQTYSEEIFISKIDIVRKNVSDDDTLPDFWSKTANFIHIKTLPLIIREELLFSENSTTTLDLIQETERNLRSLGILTEVNIELDSIGFGEFNANVITKDGWSTMLTPWFSAGGGATNYGGDFEEDNLIGTGTKFKVRGIFRNESNIGWEGTFVLYNSRFPGTVLQDSIAIISNKVRTSQKIILQIPFRTLSSTFSTGLNFQNIFGKDFFYKNTNDYELINLNYKSLDMWYSRSFWDSDRLFMTAYSSINKVTRHNPTFRQAFDNSGYVLINFSSLAQDFDIVSNINSFLDEDLVYGGYGSATIGKIFPLTSDGDNLYYVAGGAQKSFYNTKSYLFLHVAGGSGFNKVVSPKYTYQESYINFYHRLNDKLIFTSRFSEQTVWNWTAFRQLILDNDNGLRGVSLNSLSGDSRMFFNSEFRYFLEPKFLIFQYSLAAFFDIGTVWNQKMQIWDAKFSKSAGLGFRFHLANSRNPSNTYRFDFPYNFDNKQFSFVFTTRQFFSAFTNHTFTLPGLLGRVLDFD